MSVVKADSEGFVRCTSRTVTDAKELISVYICYSQGNGFNNPMSGFIVHYCTR